MTWYKVLIHVLFCMSSTKNYHFSRAAPPPLSCYVKGFPLTAKSFWNTATYQKLWRRAPSPPPPRPFVAPRGQVNVSYFNYFSLFTCPSLCRQDHFTVYIWYCIQAVSTDPGTYNWGPVYKYPFLFEKGVFFPSGFAYRLHVASEDSHGKRVFSKPLFRVEIFEKMLDTMASQCAFSHQRITIFSYISFSFGHLETIEKTQRVDGDFLNTEEKKSPFSN